ncbi:Ig domain-containing protein [Vitiosangium sp. GDMCC 1.1324]|uniref:Ig domain-containing protein n=1 Tax=Vitiosangium sp. (strain GDMCC 1.1324) TaxID=2138576 RepID=UPI000D34D875|nr:Ig domain-containing protein [Vitiosangium sp. GDMCC 1.1324]PTL84477.1 hypothetical protein DAT35_05145 [Vitiosangium sp. GDMCC 1.1324]
MKRWLPWMGLGVLLGVGACVFRPDFSRFPTCDEQGMCPGGWTCLASERVCLPDCGERGPCPVEEASDTSDGGSDAGSTEGGDSGTPDAGPAKLVLGAGSPGKGVETTLYTHRFQASGGTPPYAFSFATGELPPGLSLDSAGQLSGKPEAAGDFRFTVEGVDQGEPPQHASQEFSVHIQPLLRLAGPGVLAYYESGSAYVEHLSATGGKPPYRFELVSGGLPAGIVLRDDGQVDGKSSQGTTTPPFDVRVTDSDEPPQAVTRRLQLTAVSCPTLTVCIRSSALPDGRVGQAFAYSLQVTPSSATWSLDASKLPPGITLNGNVLSGTPTKTGVYEFTVTAAALLSSSDQKTLTLTVY